MHKIGSRVCEASKGTENHECCEFDFFVLSYFVFLTTHYYLKVNLIPTNWSKTEQVCKAAIPQKELKMRIDIITAKLSLTQETLEGYTRQTDRLRTRICSDIDANKLEG